MVVTRSQTRLTAPKSDVEEMKIMVSTIIDGPGSNFEKAFKFLFLILTTPKFLNITQKIPRVHQMIMGRIDLFKYQLWDRLDNPSQTCVEKEADLKLLGLCVKLEDAIY